MKQLYYLTLLFVLPSTVFAQTDLRGTITDTAGKPLRNIAVSLLYPADSTLAFFGVTDASGIYQIQAVANGSYVLQAAGMDLQTHYQAVTVPLAGGVIGRIRMQGLAGIALEGVSVNAEKVPILLKKDTIEYNAGSFKTKPDAPVEDLLKKLPGVQVDKQGNIKAGGKDVKRVLVDGKEFFSDDHKVATKNLPSDAVDKVQVFDGMSQSALYTGIDDGDREQTINLKLKENKRQGYFGDVEAGAGTDDRFKLGAHYFRFKKQTQFAALGAFNNINQMGFTMQDYFNFSGGLRNLLEGGGGLDMGGALPGFGEQPTGLITSAAAGLNYTYESKKGRYNISYMGNGAEKNLDQQNYSRNFTGATSFDRDENLNEQKRDLSNSVNVNLRHDLDSSQQLRMNGSLSYINGAGNKSAVSTSGIQSALLNRLDSRLDNEANALSTSGTLSWTKRRKGMPISVLKASADGNLSKSYSGTDWNNTTTLLQAGSTFTDKQFQKNEGQKWGAGASMALTWRLNATNFLEPDLRGALSSDALNRRQGPAGREDSPVDSLSPVFERRYDYVRAGLSFRHASEKLRFSLALRSENGWLTNIPDTGISSATYRAFLLPSGSFQYDVKQGASLYAYYSSNVTAPGARQLMPATDYTNPLLRSRGNPTLLPQEMHNLNIGFHRFNSFAFTSFNTSLSARYTHNMINPARQINPDLSEDVTYVNVPDDYNLNGRAEYNTPVRKLGITVTVALDEQYNRGMNLVNGALNINNTFTHGGKLTIGNRKKEKIDAELAVSVAYTDSRYSLQQSLNASFVQLGGFAQVSYRPKDYLFFSATADVDRYQSGAFSGAVTVPLLQASASYYFLKARRASLTLDAFDILDKNRSVRRVSQLNYLLEQRSNNIGRYFMLSFKYKLSATGSNPGGAKVLFRG